MITLIHVTNPIEPSRDKLTGEQDAVGEALLDILLREFDRRDDGNLSSPDFEAWAASVSVSLNGHVWARSLWGEVTPQDGDTVVIAPMVRGGSLLRTLGTIAVLAASIALVATGVGAGLGAALGVSVMTGNAILAGAVSIAGNLLISAFLGPSKPSNQSSSASYDPDGPKSLAQSGVVIPKGYGTFQWGGNIISSFTELAGADQFINVLVCFGFGPARSMTNIKINNKDISTYQNCQYYTRMGTNDQTEIPQFNQISNGYGQDIQCLAGVPVVIPGTGDLTQALQVDIQFPSGIFVDTNDGNIIPAVITYQVQYRAAAVGSTSAGPWLPVLQPLGTSPVIAQNPNGSAYLPYSWGVIATDLPPNSNVVYYTDNGPHTPGDKYTVTEYVEVFAANGNHYQYNKQFQGEWQLLDINQNYVYVNNWTEGYVDFVAALTTACYNRTQILGLVPGKYDVQVTKYGSARIHDDVQFGDNFSPTIGQDMWVHSVNEITYQDLVYPNMILLGVRALATSQLSGQNINVTALIEHGLRTVDEGIMPAELLAFEEDNPACVAADMMLDPLYGGGAAPGIAPANITRFIDEWVAYAENNDTLVPDGNGNSIRLHVFNGIMDNESDLWSQLGTVTAMSRACIVPMGQDYGLALDAPVDAPVQMFTVGNILQDSFTETWLPLDDRANQVEVQFADSTRYYKEDNPLVYMDPAQQDAGVVVKNTRIRGKGITIPAQAFHFAAYKQRGNQFLLRSGSFRTDTDGIACRPFNVVALQHDVPQWGWGGRTLPGSTASLILPDRTDIPFVAGTAYTVMVQHPVLQRFSGQTGAVTTSVSPPGFLVLLPAWGNATRATRAVIAGTDCAILSPAVGSVVVSPPPGFVPAAGQSIALFDTDVLETAPVTAVDPTTGALELGTPLSRVPEEYSAYIYGPAGTVKWVRVTGIKRASELRSTIDWIDYDPAVYTVMTPLIGETSAITTSNPMVTSLIGSEILKQISGVYQGFASLAWQNGPDTVGVGIYLSILGSNALPQLVARVPSATTWESPQSAQTNYMYTVVGYDARNTYASFTGSPSITIGATGLVSNLLLGSTFAGGFGYWATSPRAGDTLTASTGNGGEAVYTVKGTALTGSTVAATQTISASSWSVGQYLQLSASVIDTCASASAPNVGVAFLTLVFTSSNGQATNNLATIALNGTSPALASVATNSVQVPPGTSAVSINFGIGGDSTQNVPVGSTVAFAELQLAVAAAPQTVSGVTTQPTPSTYTPVNSQQVSGVGTPQRLAEAAMNQTN